MERIVEELIALNDGSSLMFCDAGVRAQRMRFRAKYKIRTVCFKCGDGRINLAHITKTPLGLIFPFRNIGGVFDMGWPALAERVCGIVQNSIDDGRSNLFVVTYHFSKGDVHRGCRGMGYDKQKGVDNAARFVRQLEEVFGSGHEQVDVVMVGIETDEDLLILHDRSGARAIATTEVMKDGKESAVSIIRELYPDMAPEMVNYFLHLVEGNVAHVEELRKNPRPPVSLSHTERVLALGQGFDWLHSPNFAVIVNYFDPMLDDAVGTGAGIIINNRDEGRIPNDNALLVASIGYREQGFQYNAAKAQAFYLARLGMESVRKFHPGNEGFFHSVVGVVDMYRRKLEILRVNGLSV